MSDIYSFTLVSRGDEVIGLGDKFLEYSHIIS